MKKSPVCGPGWLVCWSLYVATVLCVASIPQNQPVPGTLDETFTVEARGIRLVPIGFQKDGKIVVSGSFSSINGVARSNLARLNADGTVDPTFTVTFSPNTYEVDGRSLPNGDKLLIWGSFTAVNGAARPGLARLNADGTVDVSYVPENANREVVAGFADGSALVREPLTSGFYPTTFRRVRPDGSLDPQFRLELDRSDHLARADTFTSSGNQLIVHGAFATIQNIARTNLARINLDGAVDPGFTAAMRENEFTPVQYTILGAPVDDQRLILALGGAWAPGPLSASELALARLTPDGQLDPSFRPPKLPPSAAEVFPPVLARQANGKLIAGSTVGDFEGNGTNKLFLARLHPDGQVDTSFAGSRDPAVANIKPSIRNIAIDPEDRILVATTEFAAGDLRIRLWRLHGGELAPAAPEIKVQPGNVVTQEGQLALLQVHSVSSLPEVYQWEHDGEPIPSATNFFLALPAAGLTDAGQYQVTISNALGTVSSQTAALSVVAYPKQPGAVDVAFYPTLSTSYGLSRIYVLPDHRIVLGNSEADGREVPTRTIWRLHRDGTEDTTFSTPAYALNGLDATGRILATVGNAMVRLREDGGVDETFQALPYYVRLARATALPDGRILCAAVLTNGPWAFWNLVRLSPNGVPDPSFFARLGLGNRVTTPLLLGDGRTVVGSDRQMFQFDRFGRPDLEFEANTQSLKGASDIALQADGKLLVAGQQLLRLQQNGTVDETFRPEVEPASGVKAIAVQADGKILIGGSFERVDAASRKGIARLHADGRLDLSFDDGTGMSVQFTNFSPAVNCLAVQPDGAVLLGGNFARVDGYPRWGMARLVGGELPGAPIVQVQPSDQVANEGGPISLMTLVSGSPPPLYQWRFKGAVIPGATNHLLTIPAMEDKLAGVYDLMASNSFGATTSTIASISVVGPQLVSGLRDGTVHIQFGTAPSRTYTLEFKNSLSESDWSPVSASTGDGTPQEFVEAPQAHQQRFYRVRAH